MSASLKQAYVSLTDYVLVASTEVAVLHYRKQNGHWQPTLPERLDEDLRPERLDVVVPLMEIHLDSGV